MPIQERLLKGIEGFEETQAPRTPPAPPTPQIEPGGGPNPYIRCPIPPLNVNTDTLRQFDEGGKIPARRVIPLPIATVSGGGNSVTNTTVVATSSGGGGGSTSAGLTATTVSFNVPALAPNATYTTKITMAKSFQLLQVTSNQPLELRVYGSSASQGADIARQQDTPPAFETTSGLVTDIVFDVPPYQWAWQNRVAANADNPQTSDIYVTVLSPALAGISPATVTISYLPMEV